MTHFPNIHNMALHGSDMTCPRNVLTSRCVNFTVRFSVDDHGDQTEDRRIDGEVKILPQRTPEDLVLWSVFRNKYYNKYNWRRRHARVVL